MLSELEDSEASRPALQVQADSDSDEEDDIAVLLERKRQLESTKEPTPSTRTSVERRLSSEVQAVIEETYRTVWTEFYQWEPAHCTRALRSLASESPSQLDPSLFGIEDGDWCVEWSSHFASEPLEEDGFSQLFDVWQWTSESTVQHGFTRHSEVIVVDDKVTPHPPYEACAPTDCSIDAETTASPHCTFIKYAGKPGFEDRRYLRVFNTVEWQQPCRDPDHRVIAFTTIDRLTAWARGGTEPSIRIYVDDIDDSGIFREYGTTPSSESDETFTVVSDILFTLRQRDELIWPGNAHGIGSYHTFQPIWRNVARSDNKGRLFAMSSDFCPNLDCLGAVCPTHPYPTGWSAATSPGAACTHEELRTKTRYKPCGPKCFLDLYSEEFQHAVKWEREPDVEALDSIIALAPNTLPCSLSRLLPQTDCYKIFARRCQLIRPNNQPREKQQRVPKDSFFDDEPEHLDFTMPVRCEHDGPCGELAEPSCVCFLKGVHCRRNCQCGSQCGRRRRGCDCPDSKTACLTVESDDPGQKPCKCRAGGRECDAELCKHAHTAKKKVGKAIKKTRVKCTNFEMQRPSPVSLAVKDSKYGLGTFAAQNIPKNTFLGTYVGEIFWHGDSIHRKFIQDYTKLNYVFAHCSDQFLDAMHAGNETRYINHAQDPLANVAAQIRLVNGEQKVGFFAVKQIREGKELFFDYGANYWRAT